MKTTILTLTVLSLMSCTKTYTCEIETITTGPNPSEFIHYYDFEGTKEEMEAFEASGNKVTTFSNNTITQTTECN